PAGSLGLHLFSQFQCDARCYASAMAFTAPPPPVPPTPLAHVDAAIDALYDKRNAWHAVSIGQRVALLDRCVDAIARAASRWAAVGASIKGISANDILAGEEWVSGPLPAIRNARLLADALRHGGHPRPLSVRHRPDGRTIARVFPANLMERLMF